MSTLLQELQSAIPDRYRVEREIGRGGMATVYVADDLRIGRRVAIKVLNPDLGTSVNAERFTREIHVLAQLNHPNILPVLDSGDSNGVLYYVMPFIEGETLAARLARERQLAVEDAIAVTCEIADALSYAHGMGVIHRDVKPENVLLSGGHAVVADFGIARILNEDGAHKITGTGISLGTAAYMSPEQSTGEKVDGRADIYSLGCLLYELLVGGPPFTAPNQMALMARHAMEPPPSIRVVRPAVPEEIEAAVMHALEKSPADRFRSVAEFKAALLGEATTAYTARFTARYPTRAQPSSRWRRASIGATLAVFVAAAGVGYYMVEAGALRAERLPDNAARVAVTYFADAPGSGLRYLADAVTEHLAQELSAASVAVASMNGSRTLSAPGITADSIGRALDVGTVVRGSLEPDGTGVRVTVQLWDAAEDREIDRKSFHADAASPVELQGSVVREVADLIRSRLGRQLSIRESALGTRSVGAWTLFRQAELRLRQADSLLLGGPPAAALASLATADSLLERAQALDARWASVPVLRAQVAMSEARGRRSMPERAQLAAIFDRGIAHADDALRLDPRNADALAVRGDLLYYKFISRVIADPAAAEAALVAAESSLVRAVRIDEGQADAWSTLSALHYRKPDMQAVVDAAYRALRADTYLASARAVYGRLFHARYNTEDFAGAMTACNEGRRRFPAEPGFVQCRLFLYMTPRAGPPDPDSAWAYAAQMVELSPARTRELARRRAEVLVAGALVAADLPDSARHVLDRARPDRALDPERSVIGWEAAVRLMLGEKDVAVDLLRDYITVNPDHKRGFSARAGWWWRDIQGHPRFRALILDN